MTTSMRQPLAALLAAWAGAAYAGPLDTISIDGYFSLEFEQNVVGENKKGDPNGSFDVDALDLVINAQPDPRLRLSADVTFEHGAATEDGQGNVAVEYAFAEYTVSDALRIRAGKMFTNFGIYNDFHTAKPAFLSVKEPYATGKIDKLGSDVRFYPRWGAGLGAVGDFHLSGMDADYVLQVTNGDVYTFDDANGGLQDVNPYEEDQNKQKAINGRFRLSPTDNLRVGVSFYADTASSFGSYCSDSPLPSCPSTTAPMTGDFDVQSAGLEMEWRTVWSSLLQAEYVQGNMTFTDDAVVGSFDIDRNGWYVMWSRPLLTNVTSYLRYESHDPDEDTSEDEASIGVAGINWNVVKNMYLKMELDRYNSGNANADIKGHGYTELKAAFAVGF